MVPNRSALYEGILHENRQQYLQVLKIWKSSYKENYFIFYARPTINMPCLLKSMGKGVTVFIQSQYVHPYEHIRAKVINPEKGHKLHHCIVLRKGVKKSSCKDQKVDERVHMTQLHVHLKKYMVVLKRITYNCVWFDACIVPDGDRRRQVHTKSTAIKRIFGLGENCWSTLAIDKTVVAHCQACYHWQWVMSIERNS